jgi:hypothetical protein
MALTARHYCLMPILMPASKRLYSVKKWPESRKALGLIAPEALVRQIGVITRMYGQQFDMKLLFAQMNFLTTRVALSLQRALNAILHESLSKV